MGTGLAPDVSRVSPSAALAGAVRHMHVPTQAIGMVMLDAESTDTFAPLQRLEQLCEVVTSEEHLSLPRIDGLEVITGDFLCGMPSLCPGVTFTED